jgi:hypothetical protein
MKTLKFAIVLFAFIALAGRANNNFHIYTPKEQTGITSDGAIAKMLTPSESQGYFENAGKTTNPTGHVSYCNAGLMIGSARSEALKAVDGVCGDAGQYTTVRAAPMLDAVSTAVGTRPIQAC